MRSQTSLLGKAEVYAKQNRKVILGLLWTPLFILLLMIVVNHIYLNQPLPIFSAIYKVNNQTKLQRLTPLTRPILTRQSLVQWAALAAVSLNNYNAANYQEVLNIAVNTIFTPAGAEAFNRNFVDAGILNMVQSQGMTITSVTQQAPTIIYQGSDLFGVEAFKIQVPLLITYQTLAQATAKRRIITLLIVKVPTWQSPSGIGIQQYWDQSG